MELRALSEPLDLTSKNIIVEDQMLDVLLAALRTKLPLGVFPAATGREAFLFSRAGAVMNKTLLVFGLDGNLIQGEGDFDVLSHHNEP